MTEIDARIWQAVIAGGVVAVGWVVNGWLRRRDAARRRAERLRDAHKALFAEIRDVCAAYWKEGQAEAQAAEVLARMRAEPDFVPFVPRESHDRVFDAMLPQIDVLPRQTIDAIVAFYALVRAIGMLAEDMRGERFPKLEPDRRIAVIEDFFMTRARAFDYGQQALRLIDAFSRKGPDGAQRLLARLQSGAVSTPGGDRSSPAGSDRA